MKTRILPLLFVAGIAFGAGHIARTDALSDSLDLLELRTAFDTFGSGRAREAQQTLETAAARGALPSESAVFLAYLQEKAGQTDLARQTLQRVETPSPIVQRYLNRLGGAPVVTEIATKSRIPDSPARLSPTDARITKLEREMFVLINAERAKVKLNRLTWDDDIAAVSRAHSAEMRDKNYFAHESPTRALKNPLDRYIAGVGFTPRLVGENVYRAWGSRSSLNEAGMRTGHKALMESPGHKANILIEGATRGGVGIVANGNGDIWITQMFAKP